MIIPHEVLMAGWRAGIQRAREIMPDAVLQADMDSETRTVVLCDNDMHRPSRALVKFQFVEDASGWSFTVLDIKE